VITADQKALRARLRSRRAVSSALPRLIHRVLSAAAVVSRPAAENFRTEAPEQMVELSGIEPPDLAFAGGVAPGPPDGRRFTPKRLVELSGIEPPTYGLQSRRSPS